MSWYSYIDSLLIEHLRKFSVRPSEQWTICTISERFIMLTSIPKPKKSEENATSYTTCSALDGWYVSAALGYIRVFAYGVQPSGNAFRVTVEATHVIWIWRIMICSQRIHTILWKTENAFSIQTFSRKIIPSTIHPSSHAWKYSNKWENKLFNEYMNIHNAY